MLLLTSRPSAHDIPLDVLVQAFVRPQGQHLTLVVRAPMHAMRDINFPRDAEGFLDIPRADAALREAAGTWIAGSVEVYENDRRTADPRLVAVRVSLPSDRSFLSYDSALEHLSAPGLTADTQRIVLLGVDVLRRAKSGS